VAALLPSCGGKASTVEGSFGLIEFLESGLNGIPRNRDLRFVFSAPVDPVQDFPERLRVQNVQAGAGSDFSKAIGIYLVNGEEVIFSPRLPQATDRGDAGLRANGNYHVYCKAGPDSLRSMEGDVISRAQEFLFDTSEFFEDPTPNDPPRVIRMLARDPTTGGSSDLSRLEPIPGDQALLDSNTLLQGGPALDQAVDPGAGGAPSYGTPWQFELYLGEPLDPATVTTRYVEMTQIFEDALTGAETADPGHFGTPVSFKVPILVEMVQGLDAQGDLEIYIRVTPRQTLVDDARYRLTFSGNILGIDFRKQFIGDNGVTGDGLDVDEPGGLGYVTEFLVYDRPAISATRTLLYDPILDGIDPEKGQTTTDESLHNSALYDPASNPGTAVGFLSDFGDGSDGPMAVSGGQTVIIDTGDEPNDEIGNPFTVQDLNPNDVYSKETRARRCCA
jgi:hypothetical protein